MVYLLFVGSKRVGSMVQRGLFLILTQYCWAATQNGVYFIPQSAIHTTHSSWIVTLTVNLHPYVDHLHLLRQEVKKVEAGINFVKHYIDQGGNSNSSTYLWEVYNMLQYENTKIKKGYYGLRENIEEIRLMLNTKYSMLGRNKRSILPGVGSLLSFLFGTATKGNLDKVRQALLKVDLKQYQLVHVMENSISVINKTQHYMQENRMVINQLRSASIRFQKELSAFSREFSLVGTEITKVEIMSKIQAFFLVMLQTFQKTKWSLDQLTTQINNAVQGQLLMSFWKPTDMLDSLTEIQKQLPPDMELPYPLKGVTLLKYYRYLQPLVIPEHDSFHVILALPVVHINSRYMLYKVISLPVPLQPWPLIASHKVESNYLAISPDNSRYALLSNDAATKCYDELNCKFNGPLYKVGEYSTCVISLYMNKSQDVNDVCDINISHKSDLPQLFHLHESLWVIITHEQFQLNIICDRKTPRLVSIAIMAGLHEIDIGDRCSAYSKYFEIPNRIQGSTNTNQSIPFHQRVVHFNSSIWDNTEDLAQKLSSVNLTANISWLPPIENMPLEEFVNRLSLELNDPDPSIFNPLSDNYNFGVKISLITVIPTVGLVCCVILCVIKRRVIGKYALAGVCNTNKGPPQCDKVPSDPASAESMELQETLMTEESTDIPQRIVISM